MRYKNITPILKKKDKCFLKYLRYTMIILGCTERNHLFLVEWVEVWIDGGGELLQVLGCRFLLTSPSARRSNNIIILDLVLSKMISIKTLKSKKIARKKQSDTVNKDLECFVIYEMIQGKQYRKMLKESSKEHIEDIEDK